MKKIKTGFDTERLRKKYLSQNRFKILANTYSNKYSQIKNLNTASFWDNKLGDVKNDDLFENFPMAEDRNQQILKLIALNSKILNLGSGKGYLEKLIWNKFGNSVSLTGTDFTKKSLSELIEKFKKYKFLKADLTRLPFKSSSYDIVCLIEVLEHISPTDTFTVLKEIFRVVKRSGQVIISVPINEDLEKMMPHNPNQHVRNYSEELLRYEVEKVGFKVVRVSRFTAFSKSYKIKAMVNNLLKLKHPNNILFVLKK